jgi:hypothetical protein
MCSTTWGRIIGSLSPFATRTGMSRPLTRCGSGISQSQLAGMTGTPYSGYQLAGIAGTPHSG